jgi:hypothetical protein
MTARGTAPEILTLTIEQIREIRDRNIAAMTRRVKEEIPGSDVDIMEEIPEQIVYIIVHIPPNYKDIYERICFETEFYKYGIINTGSLYSNRIMREEVYTKNDEVWEDFENEREKFFAEMAKKKANENWSKRKRAIISRFQSRKAVGLGM